MKVSKAGTAAEAGPDSANVPLRSEITGGFLLGRLALLNLAKPFLMPILIVLVLMILRQPATVSAPLPMTNKIVCDHVKPLAPVGEFLSGDERMPLV